MRRQSRPHTEVSLWHRAHALLALGLMTFVGCSTLPPFVADLGRETSIVGEVRIPYTTTATYFGNIQDVPAPDEARSTAYLYIWMPAVAPEIGIRALSPARRYIAPSPTDTVEMRPESAEGDNAEHYFDPALRLERCLSAASPEDISKPCAEWSNLGDNDNSAELPAQPNGAPSNAMLRVTSQPRNPLRMLARGLYRLALVTRRTPHTRGSFVVQLGVPMQLSGIAISRSLPVLQKTVRGEKPRNP